jgi:hypothetical protein
MNIERFEKTERNDKAGLYDVALIIVILRDSNDKKRCETRKIDRRLRNGSTKGECPQVRKSL